MTRPLLPPYQCALCGVPFKDADPVKTWFETDCPPDKHDHSLKTCLECPDCKYVGSYCSACYDVVKANLHDEGETTIEYEGEGV